MTTIDTPPQAHSPLPWKTLQPDGKFHTTDISDSDGNHIANVQSVPYLTTGKADAALIVRAVNNAEQLAAIAQSVIDEANDGLDRSVWRLQAAREALAGWEAGQ